MTVQEFDHLVVSVTPSKLLMPRLSERQCRCRVLQPTLAVHESMLAKADIRFNLRSRIITHRLQVSNLRSFRIVKDAEQDIEAFGYRRLTNLVGSNEHCDTLCCELDSLI